MTNRANLRPQSKPISKPALKLLWMIRKRKHLSLSFRRSSMPDGCAAVLTDHEDILVEILARLPVKTLMRFRCVCTTWRSLIADPHFVKKHMKYDAERGVNDDDMRLLFSMKPPSTMALADLKGLKDAVQDLKSFREDRVAIRELEFPVFSLRRGTWNTYPGPRNSCMLGNYPFQMNSCMRGQGGFVNGVLHWLRFEERCKTESREIMPFSLAEEKFLEAMPLPHEFGGILVCRNHLCVHSDRALVRIMMMKEYGVKESWTEVLYITYHTVPEIYDEICKVTPLWILENEDVLAYTSQGHLTTSLFVGELVHSFYEPWWNPTEELKGVGSECL
ncbi:hypothetical protein ACLB2K_067292 [Fragaria x ananassa]